MRRTVEFNDEFYAELKRIAKVQQITVAAVIKLACIDYIKKIDTKNNPITR